MLKNGAGESICKVDIENKRLSTKRGKGRRGGWAGIWGSTYNIPMYKIGN